MVNLYKNDKRDRPRVGDRIRLLNYSQYGEQAVVINIIFDSVDYRTYAGLKTESMYNRKSRCWRQEIELVKKGNILKRIYYRLDQAFNRLYI